MKLGPLVAATALLWFLSLPAIAQEDCTSITDPTARLACYDQAAGTEAPSPTKAEDWAADVVAGDIGYLPCSATKAEAACLRTLGLSEQAIRFSYEIEGNYGGGTVARQFRELGEVDLIIAQTIGANVWETPILVNGSAGFFTVTPTIDLFGAFRDEASVAMLARFPNASTRNMQINSHRLLSNGTQRFTLIEAVVDGCMACPILGQAVTFLDIGPATGGQVVRLPVGLLLDGANDVETSADLLRTRPDSLQLMLNSLGYDAGMMDGYPGPATRTALMQFQAEHCLVPIGEPDAETANALMSAGGFEQPCAGAALPAGISANVPLEAGIYVDAPEKCDLASLPYETIAESQRLFSANGFMVFGIEDGCEVGRSDIRNSVTLFRGTCYGGNEAFAGSWVFDLQSNTAFLDLGPKGDTPPRAFSRCADESALAVANRGGAAEQADTTTADGVPITPTSPQDAPAKSGVNPWPLPKNALFGSGLDLRAGMALAAAFGTPAAAFVDGAFPGGMDDLTEFERRRRIADMVKGIEADAAAIPADSDHYLVYELTNGNSEFPLIGDYDFDRGTFRFCIPTSLSLPLNGLGIYGSFPTSILVAYSAPLGDYVNCAGSKRKGNMPGFRAGAYYTIEMPDVAEAETFDTRVRQPLHLRFYCYLSAKTTEEGLSTAYQRETKDFAPAWPLVCTGARIEGSAAEGAPPYFSLDFTKGEPVFEWTGAN